VISADRFKKAPVGVTGAFFMNKQFLFQFTNGTFFDDSSYLELLAVTITSLPRPCKREA